MQALGRILPHACIDFGNVRDEGFLGCIVLEGTFGVKDQPEWHFGVLRDWTSTVDWVLGIW